MQGFFPAFSLPWPSWTVTGRLRPPCLWMKKPRKSGASVSSGHGGRSRARTYDPLIKSQLLYQLSYAPHWPEAARLYQAGYALSSRPAAAKFTVLPAQEGWDTSALLPMLRDGRCTAQGSVLPRQLRVAVNADAHQQAAGEHHRDHGGAAVAAQRQRHADHRQEPHDHGGVDEDVEEHHGGDAQRHQAAEMVLAAQRDREAPDQHQGEQAEQHEGARHAPLLDEGGEDEVGLLLGQEVQRRLGALQETLAERAPGADGDLGLGDVVAGAQRIAVGIEEGEHALALVF